ncbi:MAG: 16S rRNA (guanine(966)-N(2))-methyltransferase RsmD [Acidobacteriota bacterium]
MRVIAGRCGGLRLKAPKGRRVRPTADRAKETLFNVIGPELPGARVLDLFAGSGALGIEALSRGAAGAAFVERRRDVAEVLRENLRRCGLEEECRVVVVPWERALRTLAGDGFDVVLADPPWECGAGPPALAAVGAAGLVRADARAVLEHPSREDPGEPTGWRRERVLAAGSTSFSLYRCRAESGRAW